MKKIIITLLWAFCMMPVMAQNIIRPKIAGPNGLWVNSYNGVLFFGRTDCETRNSAMPMQLRFYYNSSANETDYGYGLGFSLGYEMRYSVDGDGNVTIETGDGRTDIFTRYGEEYDAPAGVFSTLTQYEDGKYLLTEKNGEKYYFDNPTHRRLTAQADRYDNRTILTYQDSLLIQIKDAVNHTIDFSYTNGLMTTARATFLNGTYSYEYDAQRRLRKITNPLGNSTLYAYNKQNRLEEITDANGYKTYIAYNHANMVSRLKTDVSDKSIRYDGDKTVFIDYDGTNNQYSYYRWDDKGRVIEKVGLCCGTQSSLEYDENDNVIKMKDGNGNVTSYTYDQFGNMLTLTDALGNTERYTYDPNFNLIASFTDKNGNQYKYVYDSRGLLTSLTGPLDYSKHNTYNSVGWITTSTDSNGNVHSTSYNPDGTVASFINPAGYSTKYEYDQYENIISVIDHNNNSTTYEYDQLGRIISKTDAIGGVFTISYDKIGNVVREKDALNHITAYSYDEVGRVISRTDPLNNIVWFSYDGKGNVTHISNSLGQVRTMTYNDRDKMTSDTNPSGETTYYDYDVNGNLLGVNLPNGNSLSYWYDDANRLISIIDNIGTIADYTYDPNGNILSISDGMEHTIKFSYDGLNRRVSEQIPSGETTNYKYDANSNVIEIIDALGNKKSYAYNSLDENISYTDALGGVTSYEYDCNGNIIKVSDANGNSTLWTYDALNRNTNITFADGLSRWFAYDAVGNIKSFTDRAGNIFKYNYNPNGQILSKIYPDNTQDKFTYDANGRMLSATNPVAEVAFSYDGSGRLLKETINGRSIDYSYDVAGNKQIIKYPSGMEIIEYLNVRDLITSISQNGNDVVNIVYDESSRKSSINYANGNSVKYEYNGNGWLAQIASTPNAVNLAFDYDAIGNINKTMNLVDNSKSETYEYDQSSRLVSFKLGELNSLSYTYDALGNRISVNENGSVTSYVSNSINEYKSISGLLSFIPKYDLNGNLLNDTNHKYRYDFNNNLVTVDENIIYEYDALGRRISKNIDGEKIVFSYRGNQAVEEYSSTGVVTSYVYGNSIDEILQMKRDDKQYFYLSNHLNSPQGISDNNGEIVETVSYNPFGIPTLKNAEGEIIQSSSVGNNILFTGREYDYETHTYFYRARTFYPQIGRFTQKDPLLYIDGLNDYTYATNNPIMYSDPMGLFCWPETKYDSCSDWWCVSHPVGVEWHCIWDDWGPKPRYEETPCQKYANKYHELCLGIGGCASQCKTWKESAESNCKRGRKKEFEDDFNKIYNRSKNQSSNNNYNRSNYNNRNINRPPETNKNTPDLSKMSQQERMEYYQQQNYLRNGGTNLEGFKKAQKMSQQERLEFYRQGGY